MAKYTTIPTPDEEAVRVGSMIDVTAIAVPAMMTANNGLRAVCQCKTSLWKKSISRATATLLSMKRSNAKRNIKKRTSLMSDSMAELVGTRLKAAKIIIRTASQYARLR